MVGHGGSSADSYLADPTSPIPSHYASIVLTSTLVVNLHITLSELILALAEVDGVMDSRHKGLGHDSHC